MQRRSAFNTAIFLVDERLHAASGRTCHEPAACGRKQPRCCPGRTITCACCYCMALLSQVPDLAEDLHINSGAGIETSHRSNWGIEATNLAYRSHMFARATLAQGAGSCALHGIELHCTASQRRAPSDSSARVCPQTCPRTCLNFCKPQILLPPRGGLEFCR